MAISPVSDIVVDVLQAADPAKQRAASDKLNYMREAANADFGLRLDEVTASRVGRAVSGAPAVLQNNARLQEPITAPTTGGSRSPDAGSVPAVYRKFEAVVLQSLIETMLPQNAEKIFGKGTAGSIWRSMLAEQLGNQLAKSGGVGIARSLAVARPVAESATANPLNPGLAGARSAIDLLATDLLAADALSAKKSI